MVVKCSKLYSTVLYQTTSLSSRVNMIHNDRNTDQHCKNVLSHCWWKWKSTWKCMYLKWTKLLKNIYIPLPVGNFDWYLHDSAWSIQRQQFSQFHSDSERSYLQVCTKNNVGSWTWAVWAIEKLLLLNYQYMIPLLMLMLYSTQKLVTDQVYVCKMCCS